MKLRNATNKQFGTYTPYIIDPRLIFLLPLLKYLKKPCLRSLSYELCFGRSNRRFHSSITIYMLWKLCQYSQLQCNINLYSVSTSMVLKDILQDSRTCVNALPYDLVFVCYPKILFLTQTLIG